MTKNDPSGPPKMTPRTPQNRSRTPILDPFLDPRNSLRAASTPQNDPPGPPKMDPPSRDPPRDPPGTPDFVPGVFRGGSKNRFFGYILASFFLAIFSVSRGGHVFFDRIFVFFDHFFDFLTDFSTFLPNFPRLEAKKMGNVAIFLGFASFCRKNPKNDPPPRGPPKMDPPDPPPGPPRDPPGPPRDPRFRSGSF